LDEVLVEHWQYGIENHPSVVPQGVEGEQRVSKNKGQGGREGREKRGSNAKKSQM